MIETTLNAKWIDNPKIGGSFVLHPEYKNLASLDNVILVGPRGSGKTTMLKMLTPEALDYWETETDEEKRLKESINFLAIYIPMSKILFDDLDQRFENSGLSEKARLDILNHVYILNVQESVLDLVWYLYNRDIRTNKTEKLNEYEVARILKKSFDVEDPEVISIRSFLSYISREKKEWRAKFNDSEYPQENYLNGNVISYVEPILISINEIFGFNPSQKYALCFDELDIYASDFTTSLIKSLRGISLNIIMKLTIAPIQRIEIQDLRDSPMKTHDFRDVYLWPELSSKDITTTQEKRYLEFSEKLAQHTLENLVGRKINLDELLGEFSYRKVFKHMQSSETDNNIFKGLQFDDMTDAEITIYIFKKMAEQDKAFNKFISATPIDLQSATVVPRKDASAVIRKLKEIVINRFIFTKYNKKSEKRIYRQVSFPVLYHGKNTILKVVDGNPRYLKKLMEFISDEIRLKDDKILPIPINQQSKSIVRLKTIFLERVSSIPIGDDKYRKEVRDIVDTAGKYMSTKINLESKWETSAFPSYFKTPSVLSDLKRYETVFRKAINNGAFLLLDSSNLSELHTCKNKKMRLSYLLHVEHKMPLRKYYQTSFSKIFMGQRERVKGPNLFTPND